MHFSSSPHVLHCQPISYSVLRSHRDDATLVTRREVSRTLTLLSISICRDNLWLSCNTGDRVWLFMIRESKQAVRKLWPLGGKAQKDVPGELC
jgi:hypothetical protein